ncbi:MAG: cytochrome b/b6 domain-containing protein [Deltaproteobacteria bacterium]|nr:cytochrome b/b6 domain-containing protein [Deltaproteobacteria bacterium]
MPEKLYLHPITERAWHWIHAILVIVLLLSGVQIHWPNSVNCFGSFSNAISTHNWAGILLVCDFFLWLLYNLISRRVSHYILRKEDIHPGMIVQAKFYAYDIFKNSPHPYAQSEDNKFNPLQKATYFSFMFFMMPLLLISGILYLCPSYFSFFVSFVGGLKVVAVFHYSMAVIFAAFFVAHIYLATTGHTVFADFIAMVTGYADKEEH